MRLAPTHWLDRLGERYAERVLRHERALVEVGPEAERGLFWRDMTRTAVFMVAALGVPWLPSDNLWRALGCAILGGMVGSQAIKLMHRASAYRSGWLDGRRRMVEQIQAHDSYESWVTTELMHDAVNVAGMPVEIVDKRDDEP